jgi:hypothetical protein
MRRLVASFEDEPYMPEAIRDGLRLEAIAADIAGDGDMAEEATETLVPLAEKRGVTIETSGDTTPHHRLTRAPAAVEHEPCARRDRTQRP